MYGYIYQIINNEEQKCYIGKTIDVKKRKNDHFNELKQNIHINKKLQEAWNLYGEDAFSFTYQKYEIQDPQELNDLEIKTIQEKNSFYNGYNLTLGGDGGNTRGKLTFEEYCLIYLGCQWKGYMEKIANYLQIDSSTVSTILREKSYLWFKEEALKLSQEEKDKYIKRFKEICNIDKEQENERLSYHLTENEYFWCLCISKHYSRGIDAALAKFFGKHKSFLKNGQKSKTGKVKAALDRLAKLTPEESLIIAQQKFEEWAIQKYSKFQLNIKT